MRKSTPLYDGRLSNVSNEGMSPMKHELIPRFALFSITLAAWLLMPSAPAGAQAPWAIYTMNADGSDVKKVSRDDGHYFGSPIWSHDGKKLAYDGWPTGRGSLEAHVFVHVLDQEKPADVGMGNTPSFSPDDLQIAFMVGQNIPAGERPGVWVMNADGKNREWICEGERPRWSSDGEKLVSVSRHEGFPSVYVFDTISLERIRVLEKGYDGIIGATFSPDASQLVFVGNKGGNSEVGVDDAKPGAKPKAVYHGQVGWHPDWSPQGKKLLFRLETGMMEQLQVLDLEGDGKPLPLPGQFGGRNSDANWSFDGKQIAFSSDRG
jgi:Tol biopolymer transport system component